MAIVLAQGTLDSWYSARIEENLERNHELLQAEDRGADQMMEALSGLKSLIAGLAAIRLSSAEVVEFREKSEDVISLFGAGLDEATRAAGQRRMLVADGYRVEDLALAEHLERVRRALTVVSSSVKRLTAALMFDRENADSLRDQLQFLLSEELTPELAKYQESAEKAMRSQLAALAGEMTRLRHFAMGCSLIAVLVVVGASTLVTRSLLRRVRGFVRVAEEVAGGNRSRRMPIDQQDEFGQASLTFNQMLDALQETTISRDELERTVRERTDELDRFFQLSLDMLCIAEMTGKYIRINPSFEAALGYSIGEMTSRPFLEFVHPDDRAATEAQMERLCQGRLTLDFENRYRTIDGAYRVLSWKASPLLDKRLIYAAARDVTDIHDAERALRESEGNLAITLNAIADAVLTTNEAGIVTRLNPVAEHLTGWTAGEACGRHVKEIFCVLNEKTREPAPTSVELVLSRGISLKSADGMILRARNGREYFIADNAAPIRDIQSRLAGAVLVFRDVTDERKAAEDEHRRTSTTLRLQQTLLRLRDAQHDKIEDYYHLATEECARTLGVNRVSVWLFDETRKAIVCQDIFNRSTGRHECGAVLDASSYPVYFRAIYSFESIVAHDVKVHPATRELVEPYLLPLGITSMLDVPIRMAGTLAGVVCCEHIGPARRWVPEETKFAVSFASYVMLAIERTERRQAEERLRASEEYNRRIVQSNEDCLMVLALDGSLSSMNERGLRLVNVENADALEGMDWLSLWTRDDHKAAEEALNVAREGGVGRFQGFCETSSGGARWWDVIVSPINGPDGNPERLLAVSRDITQQRLHEQEIVDFNAGLERRIAERTAELSAKEERFRLMIEQVQDYAIFMLDANGCIATWNAGAERAKGYRSEEILGRHISLCFAPEDIEAGRPEKLLRIARERGHVTDEGWTMRKDGSRYWSEDVITAIHDDRGVLLGFAKVSHDLTEHRKAQEALRESEEQFRAAMEYSAIGMALVAPDGRWLKVNEAVCRIIGYGESDLLAMDFQSITHPEDLQADLACVQRMLDGELETYQMEKRYIHRDGHVVWALLTAAMVRHADGSPRYFISQIQDITQRKRSEELMQAALAQEKELVRKAQAGEHAKSEFLAVMSHEIRTPMNGILGFADLLVRLSGLPAEGRDYAQTILQSGESLLRILDDILDFSRLEAGRFEIEEVIFSPRKLMEEISTLLAPNAAGKGLRLDVQIDPKVEEFYVGDVGRLRQILLNLEGNAIKFTEQGMITLGVKCLGEASANIADIEFAVKDTGPGISPDRLERIFEPFVQGDSSTSRRYGGTGLGLAISQRLAKLMGGDISVHSQPGTGASFVVHVPLRKHEVAFDGGGPEAAGIFDGAFAASCPLTILVAEDDRINLKLIVAMMQKFGYQPLAAKNGAEAVGIYEIARPNCILMDLQMPEMDGVEAARRIRAMEGDGASGARAFIIALTANTVPFDRQRCFEAGMNEYLNKPIKRDQLALALSRASEFLRQPIRS